MESVLLLELPIWVQQPPAEPRPGVRKNNNSEDLAPDGRTLAYLCKSRSRAASGRMVAVCSRRREKKTCVWSIALTPTLLRIASVGPRTRPADTKQQVCSGLAKSARAARGEHAVIPCYSRPLRPGWGNMPRLHTRCRIRILIAQSPTASCRGCWSSVLDSANPTTT